MEFVLLGRDLMTKINYNHSKNLHLLDAPSKIFPMILQKYDPKSILDVGCGLGTWLKVISDCGIDDFLGIDGIEVADDSFLVSKSRFQKQNLISHWDLDRKFDLLLCLEVAEHLPSESADSFIQTLTNHSDIIVFSAAVPHQPGQGHINCQWINYWQDLFNKYGYACFDEIRPIIWSKSFPEWWYKQNIFIAKKDVDSGSESRISSMIHPDLYTDLYKSYIKTEESLNMIMSGKGNFSRHTKLFLKSFKNLLTLKINK